MSRVGAKPIPIPESVTVTVVGKVITVKASKGELAQILPAAVKVAVADNHILVSVKPVTDQNRALHGLFRSLINNMIIGVTAGFSKTLELTGTGFRVNLKDKDIELSLGFSHPVVFVTPEGITLAVKDQKIITVIGADKQLVGQVAANIRKLRPPDAYKGKGVRYQDELVKLKPGKAAKAAGE